MVGLKREDHQAVQKYMEKDPGRTGDGDEAVSEPLVAQADGWSAPLVGAGKLRRSLVLHHFSLAP